MSFHSHLWIQIRVTIRNTKTHKSEQNCQFFTLYELEIWQMTFNKANLRDLIAATVLVILLKLDSNSRFFALVTLKFDGWPRKIIRHVFYTTSSFVYHFISVSEFKLELQFGNAPFWVKLDNFLSCVTLQFDAWPLKTIGHLFYSLRN